jgi:hypothetical protein
MRRSRPPLWALLLATALAALVLAAPASGEAFGSPREHYVAEPIVDSTAFWTGEEIVLLGGRNASGPQPTIQRFDPVTDRSRVVGASLPNDTQAAAATWAGVEGYVFGGADIGRQDTVAIGGETQTVTRVVPAPHDQILTYHPSTAGVTRASASLPNGSFGSAAAWVDDAAYIVGGANLSIEDQSETEPDTYNYELEDWILRYDPDTETLERVGTFPEAIKDAEAVAYDGDIYLFGGIIEDTEGTNTTLEPSDAIWRYDPDSGNVTQLDATSDVPLRWFSTTLVQDRAYLFGGCRQSCEDPPEDESQRVYRFNFTTGTLDHFGTGQVALTWGPTITTMAVDTGDDVWVIGGGRGLGQDTYDDVYANATIFQAGPTPPSAPRNLSANASEEGVELDWSGPLDDGGWGLDGYAVERSRPGAAYRRVATVDADVTEYTDGGAEPNVEHSYRIRALAPGGQSPPSSVADAVAPTRPPAAPERVDPVGAADAILVRWSEPASNGGEPITTYKVYRNGSLHVETADATYRDTDVHENVTYSYEVSAVNAEGESARGGPGEAVVGDNLLPPENFSASSGASVKLSWSSPPNMTVDHYEILRGQQWDDLSLVTTVQTEGYTPDDVEEGTPYWFAVAGVSDDQRTATTLAQRAAVLEPPSPPQDLSFEASPDDVVLSWKAPADLGGADEVYYDVVRGNPDGSESFLNPDFWEEPSWVDADVEETTTYNYTVEAVTAAGSSEKAGPVEVTVPQRNTPPTARLSASTLRPDVGQSVTFDASGSTDGEGAVVESQFTFGDGTGSGWIPRLDVAHDFSDPGKYSVKVRVKDDRGAVSNVTTAVVTVSGSPADNGTDGNGTDGNGTDDPTDDPDENTTTGPAPGGPDDGGIPGPGVGWAAAAATAASLLHRLRSKRGGRGPG